MQRFLCLLSYKKKQIKCSWCKHLRPVDIIRIIAFFQNHFRAEVRLTLKFSLDVQMRQFYIWILSWICKKDCLWLSFILYTLFPVQNTSTGWLIDWKLIDWFSTAKYRLYFVRHCCLQGNVFYSSWHKEHWYSELHYHYIFDMVCMQDNVSVCSSSLWQADVT